MTGGHEIGTAVLAAMALELACSPWTDELRLTLVGDERLSPALAQYNVETAADVDALLDRLEQTSRDRGAHGRGLDARDLRLDPEEFVARRAHGIGAFAFHRYRFADPDLGAWVRRVGALLASDAEVERCRERVLSADERAAARRAEAEGF